MGVRVFLPMYTERPALRKWLDATNARTVVWSAREVREAGTEADRLRLESLTRQLEEWGASALCLYDDFDLPGMLARAKVTGPSGDDLRLRRMLAEAARHPECLALTTSGSSGEGKLVGYTQRALLSSCASWEAAGLFREDRLGGRGLCLLFSHSMGIRTFWNSLWTGQPVCLIPPEWFLEHPERVRTLLQRMQPEHVTGGPAVYRALLELVRVFPDLKDNGLDRLRCLVSSGAPFDEELAQRIEAALGLRMHNALGTTETMQVLSTVLTEDEKGEGMGAPLPGVAVAFEPLAAPDDRCRLLVHSPFGFAGYLPTEEGQRAEPAPYWYATGDLVRRSPCGLVFAGREHDDFVKDGFGVKIPRRLLEERYADLGDPVVHVEVFPLREEPGLGALIFLDEGAEANRALLRRIRGLLEARHESFVLALDEFELRHFTIARFACLPGPPPRTPKGNVSRAEIGTPPRPAPERSSRKARQAARPRPPRHRTDAPLELHPLRPAPPRPAAAAYSAGQELRIGQGDRLVMRDKGGTREVVDFVGGFGATLLGHRHPDVIAAALRFLEGEAVPVCRSGLGPPAGGSLAPQARTDGEPFDREGSYVVRLGSRAPRPSRSPSRTPSSSARRG